MSYVGYPAYRPANTGWMADIPVCWSTVELKWVASRYTGGTPDRNRLDYWEDGTIPWVNSGAVNQQPVADPSTFITGEALANSSARWVPEGALVIALAGQGKTKAMVSQMAIDATCNQSIAAIVPNDRIDARFLYWWLTANYQNIRNMGGGDNRDGINLEMLGAIQCPLPSLAVQFSVSAFLTRETSQIDTLIGKQEQLIDVLGERRNAMITHAVTRGLDSSASTKDSGVEWLGRVPAAWTVKALPRYMLGRVDYRGATPTKREDGVLLITARNVKAGYIDYDTSKEFVAEDEYAEIMSRGTPQVGDILMTMEAPLGNFAAVDRPHIALAQRIVKFRASREALPSFLVYALNSATFQAQLVSKATGSTALGLKASKLIELRLAMPPVAEQSLIVQHLDGKTAKIDALIDKAKLMNVVLRERRSALISAAVTGKIDVRTEEAA